MNHGSLSPIGCLPASQLDAFSSPLWKHLSLSLHIWSRVAVKKCDPSSHQAQPDPPYLGSGILKLLAWSHLSQTIHHHHRMHPNLSDFSFFSFFSFFFLSFFPIAGRRVAFLDPGPKHLHTTYHSNPCSQYMTSIISSRVPNKPAKSQITSQTYQK